MSSSTPLSRRGRPAHPEARAARRAQILDAAHRCFVRKGFHGSTTAELSAEAEISTAGLYQYFATKDDLILELIDQDLSLSLTHIDRLHEGDDFVVAAEMLLRLIEHDPEVAASARLKREILAGASHSLAVVERLARAELQVQSAIRRAIEQGQSRGQIDRAIDADVLAIAISCLCDGIFGRLCLPAGTRGAFVEAAMTLVRRTIAPAPG